MSPPRAPALTLTLALLAVASAATAPSTAARAHESEHPPERAGVAAPPEAAPSEAAPSEAGVGEAPLFEPPPPGSYALPPIRRVRDHVLLNPAGERAPLLDLSSDQVALVSFIYASCSDAGGCPAALALLRQLDRRLAARPELARHARLVTVSFDPARDTPERMAELARLMEPQGDWRFLTASDPAAIEPVLADFDQSVARALATPDGAGEPSPVLTHVLKIFLVDADGAVRNIYSTGLLDPRLVLNDIATLLPAPPPAHSDGSRPRERSAY